MHHFTTASVEFKSWAICHTEGVNIPITNTSIHECVDRQAEQTNIQLIRSFVDTMTNVTFFLASENRRQTSSRSLFKVESRGVSSEAMTSNNISEKSRSSISVTRSVGRGTYLDMCDMW